jgi:hypothetical protein
MHSEEPEPMDTRMSPEIAVEIAVLKAPSPPGPGVPIDVDVNDGFNQLTIYDFKTDPDIDKASKEVIDEITAPKPRTYSTRRKTSGLPSELIQLKDEPFLSRRTQKPISVNA